MREQELAAVPLLPGSFLKARECGLLIRTPLQGCMVGAGHSLLPNAVIHAALLPLLRSASRSDCGGSRTIRRSAAVKCAPCLLGLRLLLLPHNGGNVARLGCPLCLLLRLLSWLLLLSLPIRLLCLLRFLLCWLLLCWLLLGLLRPLLHLLCLLRLGLLLCLFLCLSLRLLHESDV